MHKEKASYIFFCFKWWFFFFIDYNLYLQVMTIWNLEWDNENVESDCRSFSSMAAYNDIHVQHCLPTFWRKWSLRKRTQTDPQRTRQAQSSEWRVPEAGQRYQVKKEKLIWERERERKRERERGG